MIKTSERYKEKINNKMLNNKKKVKFISLR